jgi:hypothetical protein
MARVDYPIEPMDLANMRENGVRSLDIQCHRCQQGVAGSATSAPSVAEFEVIKPGGEPPSSHEP